MTGCLLIVFDEHSMPSSNCLSSRGHTRRETEEGLSFEIWRSDRRRTGKEVRWRLRWREQYDGREEERQKQGRRYSKLRRYCGAGQAARLFLSGTERATGPERQLNTSAQRRDSSYSAAPNKQACGCCQETELPCADFTHVVRAEVVIKLVMWLVFYTRARSLVWRRYVSCESLSQLLRGPLKHVHPPTCSWGKEEECKSQLNQKRDV